MISKIFVFANRRIMALSLLFMISARKVFAIFPGNDFSIDIIELLNTRLVPFVAVVSIVISILYYICSEKEKKQKLKKMGCAYAIILITYILLYLFIDYNGRIMYL